MSSNQLSKRSTRPSHVGVTCTVVRYVVCLVVLINAVAQTDSTEKADTASACDVEDRVHVFPSIQEQGDALAERIADLSHRAVQDHGVFRIALSGGSALKILTSGMERAIARGGRERFRLKKWRVAMVDERLCNRDHPDSNAGAVIRAFSSLIPGLDVSVLEIDYNLIKPNFDAADRVAVAYEDALRRYFEDVPDLVVLGMGPDGHTASLFPNHRLLDDDSGRRVLSVTRSPKPPPRRITHSLHALHEAHAVIYVVAGASKASVLSTVLSQLRSGKMMGSDRDTRLPAARVPNAEWFVDAEAASEL